MTHISLPAYVYRDECNKPYLSQGDILKVEGTFRDYFREFYPKINHADNEDKYVMVLTQSCDLVKSAKRKPKVTHVNICLIRSLKSLTQKLVDGSTLSIVDNKKLLIQRELDEVKNNLTKLLNNTDQKIHFFLPRKPPFTEDMIAILSLSFSFRIDHYEALLQNRVLGLKPEFQAKVGSIISQLYGRIGTMDLSEYGWDDKTTRNYIKQLLSDINFIQVPNAEFIEYIEQHFSDETTNIKALIEQCQTKKTAESFSSLKNELLQHITTNMLRTFDDGDKIASLLAMKKQDRAKIIRSLLV